MACWSSYELDYRKLEKARAIVSKQMLLDGWNKHAGKFNSVRDKKAYKLYYTL